MQLERFLVGSVVGIGPRTGLEQNDRCTKLAAFSEVSSRRFVFDLRRPNGVNVGSVSWRPSCDQESHPKHMQVQNSKAMFMTTRSFTVCERLHVVSHNPRCLPLAISKNNQILIHQSMAVSLSHVASRGQTPIPRHLQKRESHGARYIMANLVRS